MCSMVVGRAGATFVVAFEPLDVYATAHSGKAIYGNLPRLIEFLVIERIVAAMFVAPRPA